ncbi:hypothetical protein [Kocuria marina]|uniref:hypothetical protein n=1 Tax=Kocuria marina TaxID=223184 RepID=UPI0019CF6D58|nr:hypothetical protein [Kocuria indica]MBN6812941.1 hypothetical protein [Kocuria indica]MBN6844666.1 hypothetical protein [Kocuria indica]
MIAEETIAGTPEGACASAPSWVWPFDAAKSHLCQSVYMASRDVVEPPIDDGTGYAVRSRDLNFLRLTRSEVDNWRAKATPLGMSMIQYKGFQTDLARALHADGISDSIDVRLKGSSAKFFSDSHKPMPNNREQIIDLFRERRHRLPAAWEIDEIIDRLLNQWIKDQSFPTYCPFDARFRLTVDREPSDYDVQISSNTAVERCIRLIKALGEDPTELRINHPTYNFVRKDLVETALPNVYLFTLRAADQLRRHVDVALFPAGGPTNKTKTHGSLSAHFRDDDWILLPDGIKETTSKKMDQ